MRGQRQGNCVMCMTGYLYVSVLVLGVGLLSPELCEALMRLSSKHSGTAWLFDPCHHGCKCYHWAMQITADSTDKAKDQNKRFVVNCKHSDLNWYYQYEVDFVDVVQNLPHNTTDLVVSNFPSLEIGMALFQPFLHPQLLTFTVDSCWQVLLLSNAFKGKLFDSIRTIQVRNNLMKSSELEKRMFWILPSVEIISVVQNMFLEVVENEAFGTLHHAKIINLTRNSIKQIQMGAFGYLPLLTTLDLSYNSLTTIPGEDMIRLSRSSLKHVYLEGNLWNCSCEMVWILVLNRSILADSSQAICHYPSALNGTPLDQLTPKHFQHCCSLDLFMVTLYPNLLIVSTVVGICMRILWKVYNYRSKTFFVGSGQIGFNTVGILGPNVFKGKLKDGRLVAIKKVPRLLTLQSKELEILLHISNIGPPHPNVIRYLLNEDDNEATYIALELCKGNLRDLLRDAKSSRNIAILSQLTSIECLCQIAQGLHHIHGCNIEHRDIKPANILWDASKSGKLRFIVSDFDLGHFAGIKSSHKAKYGSMGWSAPELWIRGKRTSAVDIFSLGCVFFYVLTRGGHPFGLSEKTNSEDLQESVEEWQENIESNQFSLEGLVEHCGEFEAELAKDLIESMIQNNANKRPTAHDVLQHPLFWDTEQQKRFFHQMGNYMENKQDSKCLVERLEQSSSDVFQDSWMDVLDTAVKRDVKGFKEQKTQLCGLLRVIRNKIEHFQKLGQELKTIYNGSPEGVIYYYNNRFPKLLIYTYRALQEVRGQV